MKYILVENTRLDILGISCLGIYMAVSRGKARIGVLSGGWIFVRVSALGSAYRRLDCNQYELYLATGSWGIFPAWSNACILRKKDACRLVPALWPCRILRGKYGADVRSAFGGKPLRHILFYHSQKTSQALWERDFGICHFSGRDHIYYGMSGQ